MLSCPPTSTWAPYSHPDTLPPPPHTYIHTEQGRKEEKQEASLTAFLFPKDTIFFFFVIMGVCVHMNVIVGGRGGQKKVWAPWSWNVRVLYTVQPGCWGYNLGPQQSALLTAAPWLQCPDPTTLPRHGFVYVLLILCAFPTASPCFLPVKCL